MKTPEVGVRVTREILDWAVERSGEDREQLEREFKQLRREPEAEPILTFSVLERLANRTKTPIGNFFLSVPPEISLGMVEFRGAANGTQVDPSPDLIETVAQVRELQEWYKEFLIDSGAPPIGVHRSITRSMSVREAAAILDAAVGYHASVETVTHGHTGHWSWFSALLEAAGISVMKNGVVGNNTHRPLDTDEFRAFAISDEFAPVVFINGKDEDSASVFSLAHELTHIGLGLQSVTRILPEWIPVLDPEDESRGDLERWCNAVAAELLVPAMSLSGNFSMDAGLDNEIARLSRKYRVSRFVILIKLRDEKLIEPSLFREHYAELLKGWKKYSAVEKPRSGGGDAYRTMAVRFSKSISRTIVQEAIYGRISYSEALELLRLKKATTISGWANRLGIT